LININSLTRLQNLFKSLVMRWPDVTVEKVAQGGLDPDPQTRLLL
jgi:hypothetical protein